MSNTENSKSRSKGRLKTRFKLAALFIPSLLLVIAGVFMFIKTRGTQLLFISASLGRIYRGWWIFLIAAVICFAAALLCGKRIRKAAEKRLLEAGEEVPLLDDGDKDADSKTADSKLADGKTADSKLANGKTANGKTADSKTADIKSTDSDSVAAKPSDDNHSAKDIDAKFDELDREFDELMSTETTAKPASTKKNQFCPECGAKLVEGAAFCPKCGKKLG